MLNNQLKFFWLLLLPGIGMAQQASDSLAATSIREAEAVFSRNLVAGNWKAVADAYTEDAKIFPNGSDVLQGREAILQYWTPPADRDGRTVYHRIIPEEIRVQGAEAWEWGRYEGRTLKNDGSEITWQGKFVAVWKETEPGNWKLYLDIWNRTP